MKPTFKGTQRRGVLHPKPTVHSIRPRVIQPRNPKLENPLRFNELLGDKGILRDAFKHRGEGMNGVLEDLHEILLVGVTALDLIDQHLRGLSTGAEAGVAFPPEEGLVAPGFLFGGREGRREEGGRRVSLIALARKDERE
jgi:hypothetical protein